MPTGGTIIALATPGGFSPRAIIRVSGPDTRSLLNQSLGSIPPSRRAETARFILGEFTLPVLVVYFQSPRSYTGEDAAEIILPGNPHLIERVMDAMLAVPGLRRASPGEFSARAYLNDKLTIEQAEGIAQLIAATSEQERAAAERLMSGETSNHYRTWADELATLLALVEAGIDFTDQEDVVAIAPASLNERLADLVGQIENHLGAKAGAHASHHHPRVVLAGPPNAGKSTLFNALLGRHRAIVSDEVGTTRDVLSEELNLAADLPGAGVVTLMDLAGLDRTAHGNIDRVAQERAHEAIAEAEVVLLCDPAARFIEPPQTRSDATTIRVRSKGDLPVPHAATARANGSHQAEPVAVCALDGWHLPVLRRAIADAATGSSTTGVPARHRRALAECESRLNDALALIRAALPEAADEELVAGSLRSALDALGELIGQITPDDVIGRVFATFCVGK